MLTNKFSRTISLLIIATLSLALANTVSANIVDPATKYAGEPLQLITFFLFFVGYISMGAAFVFFMSERNNVAPQYQSLIHI